LLRPGLNRDPADETRALPFICTKTALCCTIVDLLLTRSISYDPASPLQRAVFAFGVNLAHAVHC
jgi:hypothetical protein